MKVFKGNIVLKNSVKNGGFIGTENGKIVFIKDIYNGEYTDLKDSFIAPGFIDIHCHGCKDCNCDEDFLKVADYHKSHGTTSMLLSFYRNIPQEKILECLSAIKEEMKKGTNIVGAHLEGPYLSYKYGSGFGCSQVFPDKKVYFKYIESGIVKQWTSAPEVEGVTEFIKDIVKSGIVPSIGHSEASYNQVLNAYKVGAKIATHIFDATGTTVDNTSFLGTKDMSFDEACMLMEDMFYEVICDCHFAHVRKEKLALLIKTVGIDRVIAITDSTKWEGSNSFSQVNAVKTASGNELYGSRLTMDKVAENLFNFGYSVVDVFKMTSYNPAKAINLKESGEIKEGYVANLIQLDKNCRFIKIL